MICFNDIFNRMKCRILNDIIMNFSDSLYTACLVYPSQYQSFEYLTHCTDSVSYFYTVIVHVLMLIFCCSDKFYPLALSFAIFAINFNYFEHVLLIGSWNFTSVLNRPCTVQISVSSIFEITSLVICLAILYHIYFALSN